MSEDALLKACIKHNRKAQKELYDSYSPKMFSVCYRFAGNKEDAEDMLQEGFIKVFLEIRNFENRGSFEGWIRRIMIHTCINHLKKNKRFTDSIDLVYASGLLVYEETISSSIFVKQVIDCIRLLPIGYRTVLNLYAIEGFSHREISKILEIEESTSRSQFTRAKSMLETILISKKILVTPKPQEKWLAIANDA